MPKLLDVKELCTGFFSEKTIVGAVNGVSFSVDRGETLGIVGESGCGKSVTSLSIMGLIPPRQGKVTSGEIFFDGENLLTKSEKEMCALRGKRISMIFQEPMTSLNPSFTIGFQLSEPIRLHQGVSKAEARERALDMLKLVGIPLPEQRLGEYPHQLSGGMRQRVMIAIALSCDPDLLIADEPTTALDVTIQAQILELMREIRGRLNTAIIMITHDMGVVAEMCDRLVIMYAGKIVEQGMTRTVYRTPLHPYTKGLLASIPRIDQDVETLYMIPGMVPNAKNMPKGCAFFPRCEYAMPQCAQAPPIMVEEDAGHASACWLL